MGKSPVQRYQKQICDLLLKYPYPVLDILLLKWMKFKYQIKLVFLKAFEEILKQVQKDGFSARALKFLNKIPEEILESSIEGDLRESMRKCLMVSKLDNDFYLSLIGRETVQPIDGILELLKETQWQYFQSPLGTREYILYQALDNKTHFLTLIPNQITNFNEIEDVALRNNLIILKLVQEFSITSQLLNQLPNVRQCLEYFNMETIPEDIKPVYEFFYRDFKRITVILNYVDKFKGMSSIITVDDILKKTSNLEIINKFKLLNSYEEAKRFLDTYYMWQNTLTSSDKDYELETLCNYFILSCVHVIIVTPSSEAYDEFYTQKLQYLNSLLRQMKNFEILCQILEDIIKLTYLRWEHLQKPVDADKVGSKGLISSDATYTDDEIPPEASAKTKSATKMYYKTGFICKPKAFSNLYNFLKTFVTKKLHSADFKNACSDTQQRFQNIVDYITDILWKYSLLEKLEQTQNQSSDKTVDIYLDPEYLHNFVRHHIETIDRVSSDDEENQTNYQSHYSSLSRRKAAKKRRRATFSGITLKPPQQEVPLEQHRLSVNSTYPLKRLPSSGDVKEIIEERSVIPKLLGSPERLAAMALTLKSFNDAKRIIEVR